MRRPETLLAIASLADTQPRRPAGIWARLSLRTACLPPLSIDVELLALRLVQFHPVHRMFMAGPPLSRPVMNQVPTDSHPGFTPRQGQYLAFIHAYTLVNGRPPAQADIQRFFRLTPPSVHQMLLTLEDAPA